jgi:inorganic pyrophosphatase
MTIDQVLSTLLQAHPWHGVAPGKPDDILNAYVEIVPTDAVKYELDKPSGHLRIDRPQRYSSQAPSLYGFIPQTFCGERVAARCSERTGLSGIRGDQDPMDICILTERTAAHGGFFLNARALGGLRMIDGDEADDKIVAVLEHDIAYGQLKEISAAPVGVIDRLRHYFLSYKQIPGQGPRKVQIAEVYGRDEAVEVIRRSIADYRAKFGAPEERWLELRRLVVEEAQ